MHLHIPAILENRIFPKKKMSNLFIATRELIRTPVYRVVHHILNHTLIHLGDVEENLKYWQFGFSKDDSFSISGPHEHDRTINRLFRLRCSLATFLSKVYAENDKFSDPAYLGWDRTRLLVLYTRNILNHFFELEESIQDKIPYPASAGLGILLEESIQDKTLYPARGFLKCKKLSLKKPGDLDENEDLLLRWSADNFREAVDLLSSNLNKLDEYLSFMVVKYSKPSKKSRHRMYYTFGAIGVSLLSLWLLRDGRLGVVHNWAIEAKELATALLLAPFKSLTLASGLQDELMKLEQRRSIRDISFKKELEYTNRYLSGENSALPMANKIEMGKHCVEMLGESCELYSEMWTNLMILLTTVAAIPAIVLSIAGLTMISHALVEMVLGEGGNDRAQISPQIHRLVRELDERFIEYKKRRSQGDDHHYNHGLILSTLDQLYIALESGTEVDEWDCFIDYLLILGKPAYSDSRKLKIISLIKEKYAW